MNNDIVVRMGDSLARQDAALDVIEKELSPWATTSPPWDEAAMQAIEDLQRRHGRMIAPLKEEYRVLRDEWARSEVTDSIRMRMRERAQGVAKRVERVQALQAALNASARAQIETIAQELSDLLRNRRQTRQYHATPDAGSNYIDREA